MSLLQNKVLLVTGGSRGIGKAIALLAAEQSATVVLTYRQAKDLADQVVKEIEKKGGKAFAVQMSLQDECSINTAWDEIIKLVDHVDILVNNAAELLRQNMLTTSAHQLDMIYQSNLRGPFLLSNKVALDMIEKNIKGSIINISSDRDTTHTNNLAAYQMLKAALKMLSEIQARNLAPAGIRVNTVAPGMTQTDMHHPLWHGNPAEWKKRCAEVPLQRAAIPNDVAELVVFLASDSASYISGGYFLINGGRSLGNTAEALPRPKL